MIKILLSLLLPLSLWANATHILMVRHGETDRNAEGKEIQGWVDDEKAQLNEKGQAQAEELGKKLKERYGSSITTIYSSPLSRCIQTAIGIAKSFESLPIVEDRRFMEICHGQHDTMSFQERNRFCLSRYVEMEQEFKAQYPGQKLDRFFKWTVNPLAEREILNSALHFDEALETLLQLFERATAGCDEIASKHPCQMILISSHSALIRTLADEAEYRDRGDLSPLPVYYEPRAQGSHYMPGNCSVYHFVWDEGHLRFLGTENLLE